MILEPGENCQRIARANRLAFLIDGDAYFAAFRAAAIAARRSILITGWDVDSHVRLTPEANPTDGLPPSLLPFFNALCERNDGLSIHVLAWDFSVIYAFEREPLPTIKFAWRGHPRVHFALDDEHPVGASHHQKIVVIDDEVAFVGGLDLTFARWDTPEHAANDPRRVDADGKITRPMHDVQMAVDGEVASALGSLFRERWSAATGHALSPATPATSSRSSRAWPAHVAADIEDTDVAIARTVPAAREGERDIREVERLTLDAIAAAQRTIFIENQFLTSATAGRALARRLEEKEGPEVILVLPRDQGGWLEQSSMGILRDKLLARLHASNHHGHLRVYYPVVPNLDDGQCLGVHSKVLIADDIFVKVGSSNLSNRSMGLDTECDLALEAEDPSDGKASAIARLRTRLLAEHLGTDTATLDAEAAQAGSLAAAIEALSTGPRRLVPLGAAPEPAVNLAILDGLVCDPEQPIAPEKLLEEFVPPGLRKPASRSLSSYAGLLTAVLLVGLAWRFTPVRELMMVERLAELGRSVQASPLAPLYVAGAYLAGGLLFFPITLLIAGTTLVFDPLRGFIYAVLGSLLSACATYVVGRLIGQPIADRLVSVRLRHMRSELRRRSFVAILCARLLPIGNFSLINMLAGALQVRFRPYFWGNVLGILPGILGLTLFADRLGNTLRQPDIGNVLLLAAVLLGTVGGLALLRRGLRRAASSPPLPSLRGMKEGS